MLALHRRVGALVATALATAVLSVAAVLLGAPPARAADVFIELNPSTVEPGFLVGIRASCRDNSNPATVESPAFGMVTAQPQRGTLTAAAMVPRDTRAGTYRVTLECPDGVEASARLNVVGGVRPSRGPATGFGGAAGDAGPGGLLLGGGLTALVAGLVLGVLTVRQRGAARRGTARSRATG